MWGALAFGYQLASRLAYVLGVGVVLRRVEAHPLWDSGPVTQAFRRFRGFASALMLNDALSFVVLCVVTRQPYAVGSWSVLAVVVGWLLVAGGMTTKAWAARRLGAKAYYWYDFFDPTAVVSPNPPGPYRFLDNPMYTVGYVQLYGWALVCGSVPGLIAAAFDHAAILIFYRLVEKPHFDRLVTGAAGRGIGPLGSLKLPRRSARKVAS